MRSHSVFIACSLVVGAAHAEVLYGVQINKIYAQSRAESDAHLIQVNHTLSAACNANRLYIDIDDKELFATALASYLSGRSVDVIFITDATPKLAAGHLAGIPCKVLSIF